MRSLAAVLLVLVAGPQDDGSPADPDFSLSLTPAIGRATSEGWVPYVVDLENRSGRAIEARVRLTEASSETAVTRRVPMAAETRKRIFLYLPMGTSLGGYYHLKPRATVTDASGRTLARTAAPEGTYSIAGAFQVGLFSSDRAAPSAFGFPEQVAGTELTLGRLSAPTFPDQWIGLSSLDALILHDAPLQDLDAAQARALAEYVRRGGTVILAPGGDRSWLTHPVLSAFVPIRLGESEAMDRLPSLNRTFGRFQTAPQPFTYHRILNGRPFDARRMEELIRFDCGFGQAIVLPFDIRRPPFDSWYRWEAVWNAILSRIPRRSHPQGDGAVGSGVLSSTSDLFNAMSAKINTYPPLPLLIAITALFLVVVGPLNYTLLRRYRVTLLNVVTVPALSLGFLVVVLATGYVLKGTSTVTYSARFLSTRNGLDGAREHHLFTVFSPSTRTYRVTFEPGTYGLPLDRVAGNTNRYGGYTASGRLQMSQDGPFAFEGVGVGQWQSYNVHALAYRDLQEGIRFDTDAGTLSIENGTDIDIPRGVYVRAGRGGFSAPFGPVPAGETREFPVKASEYDPLAHLGFEESTLPGRMLAPTFRRLERSFKKERNVRQEESLLCVLDEEAPKIDVDAFRSARSEAVTLLYVGESEP